MASIIRRLSRGGKLPSVGAQELSVESVFEIAETGARATISLKQLAELIEAKEVVLGGAAPKAKDVLVRVSGRGVVPVELKHYNDAIWSLPTELPRVFKMHGAERVLVQVWVYQADGTKVLVSAQGGPGGGASGGGAAQASSQEAGLKQSDQLVAYSSDHAPAELGKHFWFTNDVVPGIGKELGDRCALLRNVARTGKSSEDDDNRESFKVRLFVALSRSRSWEVSAVAADAASAKVSFSKDRVFAFEVRLEVDYSPPLKLAWCQDFEQRRQVAYGVVLRRVVDELTEIEKLHDADERKFTSDSATHAAVTAAQAVNDSAVLAARKAEEERLINRVWAWFGFTADLTVSSSPTLLPPTRELKSPVRIFLFGPAGGGKSALVWTWQMAPDGKWCKPDGFNVRYLPPYERLGGTEVDVKVPPIAQQFGKVHLVTVDQKGGSDLVDFDPNNPFHVLVLVAPAAALQNAGESTSVAQDNLKKLVGELKPHVVLVTKINEVVRASGKPVPSTPEALVAEMNAVSKMGWPASVWTKEYFKDVSTPVLGGEVPVLAVDLPVLQAELLNEDPRKLDVAALNILFDGGVYALVTVLVAVKRRAERRVNERA